MKILIISPKIPYPPTDGGKIAIYGLIKELANRNHRVDLIAYDNNSISGPSTNEMNKICRVIPVKKKIKNNLLKLLLNFFSTIPYNISKYNTVEFIAVLEEYLHSNNPDIIQVENLHMGFVVDYLRKKVTSPIILRQHNLELRIMERYALTKKNLLLRIIAQNELKKFYDYEPRTCKKFNMTVMITDKDRHDLLDYDNSINSIAIPVGVDSKLLAVNHKEKIPYSIFHIGSLNWHPNLDAVDYFINEILPELIDKNPRIKFYIYGGDVPSTLKIPSFVQDNVIIKGFVENLWEDLTDKELAVVPLRIGSGMRVKIVELLAAGFNIVTTSIGKEGITVNNREHILVADTKKDFVETILKYFNNEFDKKVMIEKSRTVIQNCYTWEKVVSQFEQTYKQLTG